MLETLRTARGVLRSFGIYRGWNGYRRARAMDAIYGHFIKLGDLAFDIGAHSGDRVASFRRLGARVVAVEPQSVFAGMIVASSIGVFLIPMLYVVFQSVREWTKRRLGSAHPHR